MASPGDPPCQYSTNNLPSSHNNLPSSHMPHLPLEHPASPVLPSAPSPVALLAPAVGETSVDTSPLSPTPLAPQVCFSVNCSCRCSQIILSSGPRLTRYRLQPKSTGHPPGPKSMHPGSVQSQQMSLQTRVQRRMAAGGYTPSEPARFQHTPLLPISRSGRSLRMPSWLVRLTR